MSKTLGTRMLTLHFQINFKLSFVSMNEADEETEL